MGGKSSRMRHFAEFIYKKLGHPDNCEFEESCGELTYCAFPLVVIVLLWRTTLDKPQQKEQIKTFSLGKHGKVRCTNQFNKLETFKSYQRLSGTDLWSSEYKASFTVLKR